MKLSLLITSVTLFVFNYSVNAQFSFLWNSGYQHTQSLTYSNEGKKIVKDASGNIYVLADATSNLDPNGNVSPTTYHYTVLLKYSNAGALLNSKVINVGNHITSGNDIKGGFGLEFDNTGFLYIGFNIYSAATGYNVCISKYNTTTMSRLWIYTFNPATDDQGIDLKVGAAGLAFAIVSSQTGSTIRHHIISADNGGTSSAPLYSFDQDIDFLNTMVVDPNYDVFVTGYRFVSGVKNALTAGIKSNGILKWKKIYNGGTLIRDDSGKQILLASNGSVYVCGTSDRGNPNLNDVMVLGYGTATGKFLWAQYIDNGGTNDNGVTLKQADANNIYVGSVASNTVFMDRLEMLTGTVTGHGSYAPIPHTPHVALNGVALNELVVSASKSLYISGTIKATDLNNDPFSATYLAKFLPVTSRISGVPAFKFDFDYDVEGDFNSSYRTVGLVLNSTSSEVYQLRDRILDYVSHSREAVEVVSYDIPVPVRIADRPLPLSNSRAEIFPNPASDYVNIFNSDGIDQMQLTDPAGRLVLQYDNIGETYFQMDVSHIPVGLYFTLIKSSNGNIQSGKLLIK